jgi:hemerythrin superfamily protein
VTSTPTTGNDVLAAVRRDHRQIGELISQVESASGEQKQTAFEALVRKLAVHETAEEEVVHPLGRMAGADDVVRERLEEEGHAKRALSDLDGMSVDSPEFEQRFAQIKAEVLDHARHEEDEEHPRIAAAESPEKLQRLAGVFEVAEATAPTHPHKAAPTGMVGNLVIGPMFSVVDRVRDAVRDARRRMG